MGLREYKAGIGRFIEKDPIGQAGGPNLYAFVDSQPLSLTDPTGMKGTEDKKGGGNGGGWKHYPNEGWYNKTTTFGYFLGQAATGLMEGIFSPLGGNPANAPSAATVLQGPQSLGGETVNYGLFGAGWAFARPIGNAFKSVFGDAFRSLQRYIGDTLSIAADAIPAGGGAPAGRWAMGSEWAARRAGRYETKFPENPLARVPDKNIRWLTDAERPQFNLVFKDGRMFKTDGTPFYAPSDRESAFVMTRDGTWYAMEHTGAAEARLGGGVINHSSLMAGGDVAMAGELVTLPNGTLVKINNRSGHYFVRDDLEGLFEPGLFEMYQAVKDLSLKGIEGFSVELFPFWKPIP